MLRAKFSKLKSHLLFIINLIIIIHEVFCIRQAIKFTLFLKYKESYLKLPAIILKIQFHFEPNVLCHHYRHMKYCQKYLSQRNASMKETEEITNLYVNFNFINFYP